MSRIINIIIIALLLPLVSMAQSPEWLQDVERTAQNPQIHKQDIVNRLDGPDRNNIIKSALRTPYVRPEYKVYDYTGVLSDDDADQIRTRINAMIKESQLDAAVVFISEPSWSDFDNENFNKDFYDYNDFGCGSMHDGVCFVINIATHRFAIFDTGEPTTYRVAGKNLSKYETEILQPHFRRNDYAGGVVACISEFESDFIATRDYELNTPWWQRPEHLIGFGIALLIALGITAIRASRRCKIQKAVLATSYEVPNSFNLTVNRNTFVSTNTVKTYIPPSNSGGGSSSGTSHSGGSGGW